MIEKKTGVACPMCKYLVLFVKDTQQQDKAIRRNRSCERCGYRFFTLELPEESEIFHKQEISLEIMQTLFKLADLIGRLERDNV